MEKEGKSKKKDMQTERVAKKMSKKRDKRVKVEKR